MQLDENKLVAFRHFTSKVVAVAVISIFILTGVMVISGSFLPFVWILAAMSFTLATIAASFLLDAIADVERLGRKGLRGRILSVIVYLLFAIAVVAYVSILWIGNN
jgi:hypothetical protein